MNDLISVIIPIYNVEPYLRRCVDSVLAQTYRNLEIILVDDGSPDRCGEICDEYAKRDSRIKVIHKENGGLSDARNVGINVSCGKYLSFVDSDDYIDSRFFEVLYSSMIETDTDVSECSFDKVYDDTVIAAIVDIPKPTTHLPENALSTHMDDGYFRQTVCNKLYKKEMVSVFPFVTDRINEDEYWTYKIIGNCNLCAHVDVPLYHYYQRNGSIINSTYSLKRLDGVYAKKERAEYMKDKYPSIYNKALCSYISSCIYAYQSIARTEGLDSDRSVRKDLYGRFMSNYSPSLYRETGLKNRIWKSVFRYFPDMYCLIRNKLGIGL